MKSTEALAVHKGNRRALGSILVFAAWFLGAFIANGWADGPTADQQKQIKAAVDTIELNVTGNEKEGTRTVHSKCVIPRKPAEVWAVTRDTDHLSSFIGVLEESKLKGKEGDKEIIYWKGLVKVLFFKQGFWMSLKGEQAGPYQFKFDAFEGDFHIYRGGWRLEETPEGNTVLYREIEIKPKFFMPTMIMKSVERGIVQDIIKHVIETTS